MRRLLIWLTILTCCAIVLLIGVHVAHSDPASTVCVQLLTPSTGEVLTMDANTGATLLDARGEYPLPFPYPRTYDDDLSPDQAYIIEHGYQWGSTNATYGKRSTTGRHRITFPFNDFLWSPDSQHIAFNEAYLGTNSRILVSLTIADLVNGALQTRREVIKDNMEYNWLTRFYQVEWSPDGTRLAFALFIPNVGANLALRSIDSDQSIYVPMPDQRIYHIAWSPRSQTLLVFTMGVTTPLPHRMFVLDRNGQILTQTTLTSPPTFVTGEDSAQTLKWSADGQYFSLMGSLGDANRLAVYTFDGHRALPVPLEVVQYSVLWSTQPHTLIYMIDYPAKQTLYALDVTTRQALLLVDDIPHNQQLWLAPDHSAFAVVGSSSLDRNTLHMLTLDLRSHTTPFGELANWSYPAPQWSADSQRLLLAINYESEFTINWVQNGELTGKSVHILKQNKDNAYLDVSWQTNELILIQDYDNGLQTMSVFDTRSGNLLPLAVEPSTQQLYTASEEGDYLAVSTESKLTLYRMSDGHALFSADIPYVINKVAYFVAADERAALLLYDSGDDAGNQNLNLLTSTSQQTIATVANSTEFALPAWSPDGEMFAFAQLADLNGNWALTLISRDGALLRRFRLPFRDPYTPYQQIRWTDCG